MFAKIKDERTQNVMYYQELIDSHMVLIYSHTWQIKILGKKPIQIVTDNTIWILTAIGRLSYNKIIFYISSSATQNEKATSETHLDTIFQKLLNLKALFFIWAWVLLTLNLFHGFDSFYIYFSISINAFFSAATRLMLQCVWVWVTGAYTNNSLQIY